MSAGAGDLDRPVVSVERARAHLDDARWLFVDTRFDLGDPAAGRRAYEAGHVPGAVFADLERDLSGPPLTDRGRHPLPAPEALERTFAGLGVGPDTRVVVYDARDGATAARCWWLLRYMGHEAVAVLDGGLAAWTEAGHPLRPGVESRPAGRFSGSPRREWVVTLDEVARLARLIDARDPARFRGEHEPLDPVAGHIPGAVNRFYRSNLDERGRFLPPERLRDEWLAVLDGIPAREAACYCGSGVTACHDLLALERAGLGMARLYVGSWSEWCRAPGRPIARGDA